MYGIYANIWGILMVNVSIYTIHGSYGKWMPFVTAVLNAKPFLVSHDAPHKDAFSVKEIVNIESFLFDILPHR